MYYVNPETAANNQAYWCWRISHSIYYDLNITLIAVLTGGPCCPRCPIGPGRPRSPCTWGGRIKTRVISVTDHVISLTDHVISLTDHVILMANHVISLTDHVISLTDHVISLTDHMISQ